MRYVILDMHGALRTIDVEGFIPAEYICVAPAEDYADSDLVQTVPGIAVAVDQVKKAARLAAEAIDLELAEARLVIEQTTKDVIRQLETGVPMYPAISAAREAAFQRLNNA